MDCKTMMAPIKTSLYADEPAGKAIDFMAERHMGLVPVTNRDGTFAGLIGGENLMQFLLPRALSTMSAMNKGTAHAAYLHESAEEMTERLDEIREKKTIGDLVDSKAKTVNPETPLVEALMLITTHQYVVPVVDDENKLLGAISFFSVLYGLREEYDRETVQQNREKEREERRARKEAAGKEVDG